MQNHLKHTRVFKKLQKNPSYARLRQYLPMPTYHYIDDRDLLDLAEVVKIDWPDRIEKPIFGVVKDYTKCPRWTKYCRFLENNSLPYDFYNIHNHDWLDRADDFDIVIGFASNEFWHIQELHRKYFVLENFLGKSCYPSFNHMFLYEDKSLEAYISKSAGIPFINTYISHNKQDALALVERLSYPIVCKIVPSSGSVGVELVRDARQSRKIVEQVFSNSGRKTHLLYFRQKNFIYFQDYVPNEGFDIRAIVIGDWIFGYYRKVLEGDFRASGMNLVEKRDIPQEVLRMAHHINGFIRSPMLVVDMLHGLDGRYYVIEFSPMCLTETPEQLHVNGIPGVYRLGENQAFHFEKGRWWVPELALREFLLKEYLPKAR